MRPGVAVGGGLGFLVLLLLVWCLGGDPLALLQNAPPAPTSDEGPAPAPPAEDEEAQFVSAILASTEDAWSSIFAENSASYPAPRLVLFTDIVRSGCGTAGAATGPFYCPLDSKLYLDFSFFNELSQRFGAPGDFAAAYVIAHEVGHHVQNLLGIADQVRSAQERSYSQEEANKYSVSMELQADCLAGVWGAHAQQAGIIESGDFEEGLTAEYRWLTSIP